MAKQTPDQTDSEHFAEQTTADEFNAETSSDTGRREAADATGTSGEIGELLSRLTETETSLQQARNDYLRVQAEMQNLRRRTEQDIEKAHKYGQERFSSELLTVMDNLERALESASGNDNETVRAIFDGVELTRKSFLDCLKRHSIEPIDPLGEPFDPKLHQAISMQENPKVEPNSVIAVMQKGYTLHGRVIRPAMVMVSK